jgi:hypothetical protein
MTKPWELWSNKSLGNIVADIASTVEKVETQENNVFISEDKCVTVDFINDEEKNKIKTKKQKRKKQEKK